MDFDKFKNAQFQRRTATVETPLLSAFAEEGEKTCKVEVQGLTGEEVARARVRVQQSLDIASFVEKFIGDSVPEMVEAVKAKLGVTDEVPSDFVYRIAVLEFGLVDQPLDQPGCVKFGNACPEAFYLITSKILELTGLGQVPLGE